MTTKTNSNRFLLFSSFSALCTNRLHGTNAGWTARYANDARDAAADANDVLGRESNALDDAAALPVIESSHPRDDDAAVIAIQQSARNYKPNEFPLLNVYLKSGDEGNYVRNVSKMPLAARVKHNFPRNTSFFIRRRKRMFSLSLHTKVLLKKLLRKLNSEHGDGKSWGSARGGKKIICIINP